MPTPAKSTPRNAFTTNTPTDFAPLKDSSSGKSAAPEGRATPDDRNEAQTVAITAAELFDAAEKANAVGDQSTAVEKYLECAATSEAAHEWFLAAQSCERVGDFLLDPKPPTDLERALRMYRRAAMAYENCGLFTEARELFYRVSLLRLRRGSGARIQSIHRAELFLYWLTAGFGFRPMRVVFTAMVVIVVYGFLYWMTGGAIHSDSGKAATLIDALYFSGITFSTVGYGDLLPAPHARLIALTEGFVGAFLMGFFVVVLAHRLARS
jgi:hypothetical protein